MQTTILCFALFIVLGNGITSFIKASEEYKEDRTSYFIAALIEVVVSFGLFWMLIKLYG